MNKVALVTGSSKGIGLETSIALMTEYGYTVIAVSRNISSTYNQLSSAIKDALIPIDLDINEYSVYAKIKEHLPPDSKIDLLINNAGLLINKTFNDTSADDAHQMMNTNVIAPFLLTQYLYNHNLFGEQAHIVNISSMGGYQGSAKFPGLAIYSSTKAALNALSECLSVELSGKITVNALCLGAVNTEMLQQAFPGFEAPVTAQEMGHYIADFGVNKRKFYNGKVLPVALNNPS